MFPGLIKPVGLMAADFPAMRDRVFARYPFMRSTAFERRMLFERGGERQSRPLAWPPIREWPRSLRIAEPRGWRTYPPSPDRSAADPPGRPVACGPGPRVLARCRAAKIR